MEMQAEILSLVALLIAIASTVINYVLLRAQQDPEVVVFAFPDARRPSIINLIIENIGKGIARDISFELNRPMPWEAFGFAQAEMPKKMTKGPLIYGISFLSPGEKRIMTWGQYHGLTKGLEGNPVDVTARYFSDPRFRLTRQTHVTVSTIDIRSFEGTDASDDNWDKKSAEQLEKLVASLKSVTDPETHSFRVILRNDE
jgi:hypothetical protein